MTPEDTDARTSFGIVERWKTNLAGSASRSRFGMTVKDAALTLPLPASRALNVLRYLPFWVKDPGLRREWRAADALERMIVAGRSPAIPLGLTSAGGSERIVELPWVLVRAQIQPGRRILDVGTAFATHSYRRLLTHLARSADLHLVDLLPSHVPGATSYQSDVRNLPFADASFDTVVCISTLEHIGLDNRAYGIALTEPSEDRADVVALRELARVARHEPGLLVTVPAGADRVFGDFRQYSAPTWKRTVAAAGLELIELEYFVHSAGGWRQALAGELELRNYGFGARAAAGVICSRLRRHSS